MKRNEGEYTVGGLRAAMEEAADTTPILLEDRHGQRWLVERARLYGSRTDDPVLVIRVDELEEERP